MHGYRIPCLAQGRRRCQRVPTGSGRGEEKASNGPARVPAYFGLVSTSPVHPLVYAATILATEVVGLLIENEIIRIDRLKLMSPQTLQLNH